MEDEAKDRILKIFHAFDLDCDGAISREELARLLKALDRERWTDDELEEFLVAADVNGDGLIQYEEFISWVADAGDDNDIVEAGDTLAIACPPGMNPCRYGKSCFNRDPRHRRRFWHPLPDNYEQVNSMRKACRFGFGCFQKNAAHLEMYVHPGDRNYRNGLVSFGHKGPQFQTLWQLFTFHDPDESAYLNREEFGEALAHFKRFSKEEVPDLDTMWEEAGGLVHDHVNFARFSGLAESHGVNLPLGIESLSAARPCHFRIMKKDGYSCGCAEFVKGDDGWLCQCGHKPSMHRSDCTLKSAKSVLSEAAELKWEEGVEGLVEVEDEEIIAALQAMMTKTHKTEDNWTRDRGCKLHGRSHPECNWKCIRTNGHPVPTGYNLKKVLRNQNLTLWHNFAVTRRSIASECASDRQREVAYADAPVESNCDLCSPTEPGCNDWRLFHGTSIKACRGICSTNFRLSLSGTGATWKTPGEDKGSPLYGFGIYLAERITKADEYSEPLPDDEPDSGLCCALVVRCIGGKANIVESNEIDKHKLRSDVFDGPYHSVFGDRVKVLGKPYREIVVYDRDQIYPEYLLLYERRYD
mmetsp:Transcript_55619/g.120100  ORF Transcript_55619/g.120100 Transcript_55619/m.120100 type:complete len:583 (-) Transcript_55619:42-1790(-)